MLEERLEEALASVVLPAGVEEAEDLRVVAVPYEELCIQVSWLKDVEVDGGLGGH